MHDSSLVTATGTFTVDSWKDEPVADPDEEGAVDQATRIGWVQLSKTFLGDLAGHSTLDMLSVMVAGEPAGYVAVERVNGTLLGRTGSFVLKHSASADGELLTLRIEVVPRTGSGELAGLSGELEIIRADDGSHSYAFRHRLAAAAPAGEPG